MPDPIRLLCVDDEINILHVIKRQLVDEALEIHCARTADEGLRLLRQLGVVQVVVSDYRMPGMNGIEFFRQAHRICPSAVCILLSGFADIPAVQQSLTSSHLFRCLRKPWQAGELRQVIRAAVAASWQTPVSDGDSL
ncbi:MAG: response regulator [Pelovirga sp.]